MQEPPTDEAKALWRFMREAPAPSDADEARLTSRLGKRAFRYETLPLPNGSEAPLLLLLDGGWVSEPILGVFTLEA